MNASAGAPGARPGVHPSRKTCSECGAPLDVLQAVHDHCARTVCQTRRAVRAAENRRRRRHHTDEKERARGEALTAKLMGEGQVPLHRHYDVFPVPAHPGRLKPTDPDRLAEFRDHFERLLDAVATSRQAAQAAGGTGGAAGCVLGKRDPAR